MQVKNATYAPEKPVRVLIVDDHKLYREGLRMQLENRGDFVVVGEAQNAESGLSTALENEPDVVLMDIDMPGISCFDAIGRIQQELPNTKNILLSGHKTDELIERALEVEVSGYAVKDDGFDEVCQAIERALAGDKFFAREIRERLHDPDTAAQLGARAKTRRQSLTPRERELVVILAQGYSLKQAAQQMFVSYKTVDKHKASIFNKLDIHDRVLLAIWAIKEGLIQI